MLTYDFEKIDGPIYLYIYQCIKDDILSGVLKPGEKLPSKRSFANNNGISTITIQNAYDQLISEGYIYTRPKKGYYVARIEGLQRIPKQKDVHYDIEIPKKKEFRYDISSNGINSDNFPFSVWTKISRDVMSNRKEDLMEISPTSGVLCLRQAIADRFHFASLDFQSRSDRCRSGNGVSLRCDHSAFGAKGICHRKSRL